MSAMDGFANLITRYIPFIILSTAVVSSSLIADLKGFIFVLGAVFAVAADFVARFLVKRQRKDNSSINTSVAAQKQICGVDLGKITSIFPNHSQSLVVGYTNGFLLTCMILAGWTNIPEIRRISALAILLLTSFIHLVARTNIKSILTNNNNPFCTKWTTWFKMFFIGSIFGIGIPMLSRLSHKKTIRQHMLYFSEYEDMHKSPRTPNYYNCKVASN
jgi:hypothetical protein